LALDGLAVLAGVAIFNWKSGLAPVVVAFAGITSVFISTVGGVATATVLADVTGDAAAADLN
jgi:hypothetical protein